MNNWFSIEPIDGTTFAISEYKHWEETHCYLLCGTQRAILIDTGLGIGNIKEVVDELTELPITVITTHIHWDHIGGHKYFSHFDVHEAERDWIAVKFPIPLQAVKSNLTAKPCDFPAEFDLADYQIFQGEPKAVFADGDSYDLGGRTLIVIHTPGHSPGHCCFYEPERRYLYSGDLIYLGCLDAFYPTTDPKQFYQSVKKIEALSIDRVLPAHHQLDIHTDIVSNVSKAFEGIERNDRLKHGAGLFDFGDFQIHI